MHSCPFMSRCTTVPLFQSSPSLLAGCSWMVLPLLDLVSILTQPYWMCAASGGTEWSRMLLLVSILTQPIGWVQPNLSPNYEGRLFQSSPNLPAGCRVWSYPNFNPHPTYSLGATVAARAGCYLKTFQSSPNLSVGVAQSSHSETRSFQSSPNFLEVATVWFQSSPNFLAGHSLMVQ